MPKYAIIHLVYMQLKNFFQQFGNGMDVYMSKPDNTYRHKKIEELLPDAFTPADLDRPKL